MNPSTINSVRESRASTLDISSAHRWRNLFRSAAICCAILSCWAAIAQEDSIGPRLAPTPPMGWASWNYYFCKYDEQTIKEQADALVASGMLDLGYRYLIIQECIAPERDAEGHLVADAKRFPDGIPAVVDYIHSRGLKAGIYTDVGPYTCFSTTHYQGSYDHEMEDARTFAGWGIDLIEVDFCNKPAGHTGKELYGRMADAIRKTGRPMLLYVCSWGEEQPWEWARGMAQLWRTTEDISYEPGRVKWESVVRNFESNAAHAAFTAPNNWNDPDMLEVGNRGLTATESRTHLSMWAISAAPLWAGTDLTHMDAQTLATFTNPEVIAVDQDSLGAGLRRVRTQGETEIWGKPLGTRSGESQAVLLLNLTMSSQRASLLWRDLGLSPNTAVRDLWTHTDLGRFADGYTVEIPSHGSVLLKVTGLPLETNGVVYEAEWPGNVRSEDTMPLKCESCSCGYAVRLSGSRPKSKSRLVFPQIDAVAAGTYQISVAYLDSSAGGNLMMVAVNGEKRITVNLDKASGIVAVPAFLHAGRNKIEIQSHESLAVDSLTLSR